MEHNNKNYSNRHRQDHNYNQNQHRDNDSRRVSKYYRNDEHSQPLVERHSPYRGSEINESSSSSFNGQRGNSTGVDDWNQSSQNRSRDNDRNYDANYSHNYEPGEHGSAYGSSYSSGSNYQFPDYGSSYTSGSGRNGSAATDQPHANRSSSISSSRMSYAGKGPKGWQRSDENIRERVCDMLERDHDVDASEIEVTVKEGMVTLSGKVDQRSTKRRAEDIIENIPGVKDVKNEITVDKSLFQQAKEMFTGEPSSSDKSSNRMPKSNRHS